MKDRDKIGLDGWFELDRRTCVKAAAAGAGAAVLFARTGRAKAGPSRLGAVGSARELDPNGGLLVVLLGTGTPIPNPERACASTLVVAGDKAFLVDAGRGSLTNFAAAGFQDHFMTLFTHYHSDHFSEFGEYMVTRTIYGADSVMPVIGPEGAGRVIGGLLKAYELDDGYRKAHHGDKWSDKGMKADIQERGPGVVYDDGVKVTMFEVDHTPVDPAAGYRFDYNGKSAVVSGDTRYVPQMAEMAKGADILVHEAINTKMIGMGQKAGMAGDERMLEMSREMTEYHTPTEEVAAIARDAGVGKLVLTHMVPGPPRPMEKLFTAGMGKIYKGPIIVGRDGMEIKA